MLETLMSYKEYLALVRKEWEKYGKRSLSGRSCHQCRRWMKEEEVILKFPPDYEGKCPRCGGFLEP